MSKTSSLQQTYRLTDSLTQDVIYEFKQPIHKNRFFNNKYYLIENSDLIKFDRKSWHLRPEFYAYDKYGSSELFHVVLLVNDISSRFNFRAEVLEKGIISPTLEAIHDVLTQDMR